MFFRLMGQPVEHREDSAQWITVMRSIMAQYQLDLETMKRFLHWAVQENDYSKKYLAIAGDPMETLRKNMPTLVKRFRATYVPVDPDPLWKEVKIPAMGGDPELVQKHPARKPKTVPERREFLAKLWTHPDKMNRGVAPWLAQDSCENCKGTGYFKVKTYPKSKWRYWEEHWVTCDCIFMEELLERKTPKEREQGA
jgi:hypothetical protein